MTACPSPHLPSASCPTCARGAYDTTDLWKAAMVARAIVQETIASPEPLVWALTTVVCLMTSWGRVGPLAKAVGQALVNYLLWHRCDKTVEGVRNGAWVHPRELRCLRCVSRCCCGQQVKVTGASRAIVVTLSATMSSGAVCSWDCAVSVLLPCFGSTALSTRCSAGVRLATFFCAILNEAGRENGLVE